MSFRVEEMKQMEGGLENLNVKVSFRKCSEVSRESSVDQVHTEMCLVYTFDLFLIIYAYLELVWVVGLLSISLKIMYL